MENKQRKKPSAFMVILLGFFGLILTGAIMLSMPISSKSRTFTPFIDSLFTSASAACVTGLVSFDTATHWSAFGQIVILLLIQIGGMGVITISVAFALLTGRKISLFERKTMQESVSAKSVGGIVKLTGFILKGIFLIEFIGFIILSFVFTKDFGIKGLWYALFTSVSAFCNAGFDLMGGYSGQFSSLTAFTGNVTVNLTVCLLILIGGLGFLTWQDVIVNKCSLKKYSVQSKIILASSLFLIFLPAVYFFFAEFSDLEIKSRILASLFAAITPRTAGFNTVDLRSFSGVGLAVTILLMLTGGAPGSTAGGMKMTTVAVLFSSAVSVFRKKNDAVLFKRRITDSTIKNAAAIFNVYIALFLLAGFTISLIENLPLSDCLFESASAIGTVGLTLGITPSLGVISKLILILLMFIGRTGGLTIIFAVSGDGNTYKARYPETKINVG